MTANPGGEAVTDILALVGEIERQAVRAVDPVVLVPVQRAIRTVLGAVPGGPDLPVVAPGAGGAAGRSDGAVAACVGFAEQFVVDVAGTTDAQRAAMTDAMGRDAFTFVQVLYALDVLGRVRIGLDRLGVPAPFDAGAGAGAGAEPAAGDLDLWSLLERFMQEVARLDALDPLTTELVRLHGARVHDCRLCRSRLSVRAVEAAGDRAVFDHVLDGGGDGPVLAARQRTALALTDALVTQPSAIGSELAAAVHADLSRAEVLELVLDVARNAANKIAVALGADAAAVDAGTEWFDLDATGEVVADVDIDVVRRATA